MPTYVPDSKTKRYVIIAPVRNDRPTSHTQPTTQTPQPKCPFCPGNEAMTPPELFRIDPQPTSNNAQRLWNVRVVPNKYPITEIHEVIILSPQHTADLAHISLEQAQHVMSTFMQRSRTHANDGNVLIFGNHGSHAGASLNHPHAQLVVIPPSIPFDAISREPVANIIEETELFTLYCPEFSQWPYELWIAPKRSEVAFIDLTENEQNSLAYLMQKYIKILRNIYEDINFPFRKQTVPFGYNYYISHGPSFFVRIIPRLIHRAGFELGTGISVNTIPPTEAAQMIKATGNNT